MPTCSPLTNTVGDSVAWYWTPESLSLVMIDVDHFKLYNDTFGHPEGDVVLRRVALMLQDFVGGQGVTARYGGEEFAMVLPETNLRGAVQVANRVRSALALAAIPHAASPICDKVTLSIGTGCRVPPPQAGAGPDELIAEADRSLYLAKHRGRNRVSYRD